MKQYRIAPGARVQIDKMDPDDTGDYKKTDQGLSVSLVFSTAPPKKS